MPLNITGYRVFIASPSGLGSERRQFRDTLRTYDEDEAVARGVAFIPVGWEDTLAQVGRPQGTINQDIIESDFLVLVLWDRWGTPPAEDSEYTSGTEEEFHVALDALRDSARPMKKVAVFFKGVDERQLSDPGEELKKVLAFRRRIERDKTLLYQTFDTEEEFARLLRRHLAQWVRDDELERKAADAKIGESLSKIAGETVEPPTQVLSVTSIGDLLDEAENLAANGSVADAEALFAQAVVGRNSVDAVIRYGRFLRRFERYAHSKAMFKRAVQMATEQEDNIGRGWALANLGVIARKEEDFHQAERYFEESIGVAEKAGKVGLELLTYNYGNVGQMRMALGDLEGAEEFQRLSLGVQEEIGENEALANSYASLGVLLRRTGKWQKAKEAHQAGIEVSKRLGTLGNRTRAYNCGNLGLIFEHEGKYEDAIRMHQEALEINGRLGRNAGEALNRSHLARALLGDGQVQEAKRHNALALVHDKFHNNLEGLAYNNSTLGDIQRVGGNIDEAVQAYKKAAELYEKVDHPRGHAANLAKLGKAKSECGELDQARDLLARAEVIAQESGDRDVLKDIRSALAEVRETTK